MEQRQILSSWLLAGFTLTLTTNTGNYASVNLGQLKQAAKPFHDRLYLTNYPWLGAPATNDGAIANIGQVKNRRRMQEI